MVAGWARDCLCVGSIFERPRDAAVRSERAGPDRCRNRDAVRPVPSLAAARRASTRSGHQTAGISTSSAARMTSSNVFRLNLADGDAAPSDTCRHRRHGSHADEPLPVSGRRRRCAGLHDLSRREASARHPRRSHAIAARAHRRARAVLEAAATVEPARTGPPEGQLAELLSDERTGLPDPTTHGAAWLLTAARPRTDRTAVLELRRRRIWDPSFVQGGRCCSATCSEGAVSAPRFRCPTGCGTSRSRLGFSTRNIAGTGAASSELAPAIRRHRLNSVVDHDGEPALMKQVDYLQRVQLACGRPRRVSVQPRPSPRSYGGRAARAVPSGSSLAHLLDGDGPESWRRLVSNRPAAPQPPSGNLAQPSSATRPSLGRRVLCSDRDFASS